MLFVGQAWRYTVLDSGLSHITISTAGFEENMYRRVYRSTSYQRMKRNVLELLECNARRSEPIPITIGLRSDRPLEAVMTDRTSSQYWPLSRSSILHGRTRRQVVRSLGTFFPQV